MELIISVLCPNEYDCDDFCDFVLCANDCECEVILFFGKMIANVMIFVICECLMKVRSDRAGVAGQTGGVLMSRESVTGDGSGVNLEIRQTASCTNRDGGHGLPLSL
uniref:Uncharacterized protein n=1 Tax=Oryza meridionalis TaxID=40149 RepID=A0A0E0F4L7_9ORYZ